jgi:hypothetical protein
LKLQLVRIAGVFFARRIAMQRTLLALALAMIAGAASAQEIETGQIESGPAAMSAKQDIERAGYRDVRGLAQDSEGVWHGRALRGNTEIQLLVEPDGNVEVNR